MDGFGISPKELNEFMVNIKERVHEKKHGLLNVIRGFFDTSEDVIDDMVATLERTRRRIGGTLHNVQQNPGVSVSALTTALRTYFPEEKDCVTALEKIDRTRVASGLNDYCEGSISKCGRRTGNQSRKKRCRTCSRSNGTWTKSVHTTWPTGR